MRLIDAIMNPSAALQTTAEDFLDSLTQTAEPSQAELITCILRACGCNHTLNADEALDYDGVLDALDHITEALKQVCRHQDLLGDGAVLTKILTGRYARIPAYV